MKQLNKVMRDSRLAVNSGKTQIRWLRSQRKRKEIEEKGEERKRKVGHGEKNTKPK